jgi:hypothetical protein
MAELMTFRVNNTAARLLGLTHCIGERFAAYLVWDPGRKDVGGNVINMNIFCSCVELLQNFYTVELIARRHGEKLLLIQFNSI